MNIRNGNRNAVIFHLLSGAIILCMALSGCAGLNRFVNQNEFALQLTVEAATARVLHEHPTWVRQTVAITDNALALIDARDVTDLAGVEAFVKSRIPWASMMPEEQALVSALITEVRKNIEDTLRANGVTDPGASLVEVRKIMAWINAAAKRQLPK